MSRFWINQLRSTQTLGGVKSLPVTFAVLALAFGARTSAGSELADASQLSQPGRDAQVFRVPSKDGTLIAVECAGAGPTLIMVHGGIGDRTRWTPMFPLLSSDFTVCAMDRRGHGASGDSPDYSLQKEAEDVASVVDSRSGTVFVLGHSYGGVAALEATFLTNRVSKLILYEPPLQEPIDRSLAVAEKMDRTIKDGAREQAVVTFLTEVVQQSPSEVASMKSRPAWPELVATIDSQPRQMRALAAYRFDAERMRNVRVPTLLLIGSNTSSPYAKQAIDSLQRSLPNPTRVVLEGQQHNAMDSARELLAKSIVTFLLGTTGKDVMNQSELTDFATRYAVAWSSQNPASLAAFYEEDGSLTVNAGAPSIGRAAITATVQGFMAAFPDMAVKMDEVRGDGSHAVFRWIWTGTNTGPGGTGKSVRIRGYEEWTMGADGLIAESKGHYDDAEYQRQLQSGAPPAQ